MNKLDQILASKGFGVPFAPFQTVEKDAYGESVPVMMSTAPASAQEAR